MSKVSRDRRFNASEPLANGKPSQTNGDTRLRANSEHVQPFEHRRAVPKLALGYSDSYRLVKIYKVALMISEFLETSSRYPAQCRKGPRYQTRFPAGASAGCCYQLITALERYHSILHSLE